MANDVAIVALIAASIGCGGGSTPALVAAPAAPGSIRDACEVASRRCSRCHSLDRITRSSLVEPIAWSDYVHRMRLMPGSGIPPDEESLITECLVYRVAGSDGLARLEQR